MSRLLPAVLSVALLVGGLTPPAGAVTRTDGTLVVAFSGNVTDYQIPPPVNVTTYTETHSWAGPAVLAVTSGQAVMSCETVNDTFQTSANLFTEQTIGTMMVDCTGGSSSVYCGWQFIRVGTVVAMLGDCRINHGGPTYWVGATGVLTWTPTTVNPTSSYLISGVLPLVT